MPRTAAGGFARPARDRAPTHRALERESEQAVLRQALDAARDGRGQCVVVEGPAGIGKTDLLRWIGDRARRGGTTVAAVRGTELASQFAFGAAIQLLEPLVGPRRTTDRAASGARPAEQVAALARRSVGGGRLLDEVGPASPLFVYAGTALIWSGDYAAAREHADAGIAVARGRGSLVGLAYATALRAAVAVHVGDVGQAETDATLVLDELAEADPMCFAVSLGWAIEVAIERGDTAAVHEHLTRWGLDGPLPDLGTIDHLLMARARLRQVEGQHDAALEDLLEVGRRGDRGAAGDRRPAAPAAGPRRRCADAAGTAGRAPGRHRGRQPRDRRDDVPDPPDGRAASDQCLPQARDRGSRRAGCGAGAGRAGWRVSAGRRLLDWGR